jgi:diaminopimelate decarboxylase
VGIHCFNVESAAELKRLDSVAAAMRLRAPVSLRVNPDVDAKTHPYISTGLKENKFGVDVETAMELYRFAARQPHLDVVGIDCHIGSQLTAMSPILDALERLLSMIDALEQEGIRLRHIDLGGGLGVPYNNEEPPHPQDYARLIRTRLDNIDLEIIMEPGRAVADLERLQASRPERSELPLALAMRR